MILGIDADARDETEFPFLGNVGPRFVQRESGRAGWFGLIGSRACGVFKDSQVQRGNDRAQHDEERQWIQLTAPGKAKTSSSPARSTPAAFFVADAVTSRYCLP
jgi:hypothetical protein